MDGWESPKATTTTSNKTNLKKRAFVGNLTPNPNLETKLRQLFANSNINIHSLDIIKPKIGTNCFALVECDVGEAIKCLNGISFQGNIITVQKEKKQSNGGAGRRRNNAMGMTKFGGGWAKPQGSFKAKNNYDSKENQKNSNSHKNNGSNSKEDVKASADSNDSTSIDMNSKKINEKKASDIPNISTVTATADPDMEIKSFHSRCKFNINQLMEEYGEYDPDFQNMKVTITPESSSAAAIENKKEAASSKTKTKPQSYDDNCDDGMLAPNGTAPINVELVSFGYKYSVPPQARQGWSYSNPLSPIDCRDLPRCPHYVAKLSGLSFKVKKAFTSHDYGAKQIMKNNDEENDLNDQIVMDSNDENFGNKNNTNPLLVQSTEIAGTILNAMEEAIRDGNHGYAFPLKATVYIGSEYGRHRSVVLCETTAQKIRKLLRTNDEGRISVPISVSLRHRDVDKNHKDGEAFGDDLRREHEAEVKRKKKQEWLENRVDPYW